MSYMDRTLKSGRNVEISSLGIVIEGDTTVIQRWGDLTPEEQQRYLTAEELRAQVAAATARAEAAEATLALADCYGADQWRRGNAGKDPQEFAEWRKEAQP